MKVKRTRKQRQEAKDERRTNREVRKTARMALKKAAARELTDEDRNSVLRLLVDAVNNEKQPLLYRQKLAKVLLPYIRVKENTAFRRGRIGKKEQKRIEASKGVEKKSKWAGLTESKLN